MGREYILIKQKAVFIDQLLFEVIAIHRLLSFFLLSYNKIYAYITKEKRCPYNDGSKLATSYKRTMHIDSTHDELHATAVVDELLIKLRQIGSEKSKCGCFI